RRLAGAAGPDEAGDHAALDRERDTRQDPLVAADDLELLDRDRHSHSRVGTRNAKIPTVGAIAMPPAGPPGNKRGRTGTRHTRDGCPVFPVREAKTKGAPDEDLHCGRYGRPG